MLTTLRMIVAVAVAILALSAVHDAFSALLKGITL